ncbi:putative glyoxalase superfamily protein PhnB [Maribacter vaceletii]|uniref:Putative glyoxalase superfamily protein PhnB n=1 Tax=Maribacter vaceletii TaxID=1206816 RepID=A0A495DTH5_9FLAO|nr:VOC family protein [Maribacter vaceletii]RKR07870.1 putative glyoxalase superfamily protein PhnB [Maribacter vaceletii]
MKYFLMAVLVSFSITSYSQTKTNNMTKLESLTPNIMVKDVNATLDYYTNNLGFKLIDTNPESGKYEWGYVMLDNVGMMFQEEKSLKTEYKEIEPLKVGGALTFYIRIKDINSYYNQIIKKTNIIKPINKTFYGTNEFAIMDKNGFILTFSETIE